MDFDSDSGDFDGDFGADENSDYEYDEDGDIEMEFETEAEESAEFDTESEDVDIEYDLADQSVESTWSFWHADSNDTEYGYYVETDQDDKSEDDEPTESYQDDQPDNDQPDNDLKGDPEYTYDSPTPEAGIYDDGKSAITFHTHNDDEHGSQRHSRHIDDKGVGSHNKDERKRSRYSRPEQDFYCDYEEDEEDEVRDTPLKRFKRMVKALTTFQPMEDIDE